MKITIEEIPPERLKEYDLVPIRFEVRSVLEPVLKDGGLGGISFHEVQQAHPYFKDYDSAGDMPSDMPQKYDVSKWAFFLALAGDKPVGAATVAFDTTGIFMLESRKDLAVLWDIRSCPEFRGVGIMLFRHAAEWARLRGCTQMKIETQNVNVPACRFYQRMGACLGEIRRFGYAAVPAVAHEVMLCWYLDLT
jgi:GNAT superfamily N-acetyltransferase